MCQRSYECDYNASAEYQPSEQVRSAFKEAAAALSQAPGSVRPVGRRFFGAQRYVMSGWYLDQKNKRIVELCVNYIDRGRIANYLLNPHGNKQRVQTVSIAHVNLDVDPEEPKPYRLFMYRQLEDRLDTCVYNDYQADTLAVSGLGSSVLMSEQYDEAVRLGEDVVTDEQAADLVRSLELGITQGWRTEYDDE